MSHVKRTSTHLVFACLAGTVACAGETRPRDEERPAAGAVSGVFGFSGLEIYKLDADVSRLRAQDVNKDGLKDIAIVNNSRATIDFFIQKTPEEISASRQKPLEYDNINEIASDARFRKESFLTEKKVFDLLLEDLDRDGHSDLVYYGDPKELVVVRGGKEGWSAERQRFPIQEARAFGRGLGAGDLNGDERTDVALLGSEKTFIFFQEEGGRLAEPIEFPNSEKVLSVLTVTDLDGDRRADLVLAGSGLVEPIRVRLQGPQGLGPEIAIETAAFRSLLVKDLTGDGRPEISVVQAATGRLVVFDLEVKKADGSPPLGRIQLFPLAKAGESSEESVVFGDVDGDGRTDILETSATAAQFLLYRQGAAGDILPPLTFPSLAGAAGTRLGDLDGDGRLEIVVLSPEEKAIAFSRWKASRLAFPKSLPLQGKPVSCALANLSGDGAEEVAVAVEEDGGVLVRFLSLRRESGDLVPTGEPLSVLRAKDAPDAMLFFDADQDGRLDLLAFFPYEAVRIYRNPGSGEGKIPLFADVSTEKDFGKGLLQGALPQSFAAGDVNGDGKAEFFLAKKNFARAFRLSQAGSLEIVDQFNARDPAAEIVGAAFADLTGDAVPEVVLLDKTKSVLWVLERGSDGAYKVAREAKIPAFRYRQMSTADLNGDKLPDLFISGDDRFGIIHGKGTEYQLRRVGQYESELKDARLDIIAAGDLDSDGRTDIVLSELSEHLLEILVLEPGKEDLKRASRFKVFEAKASDQADERRGSREPREILIADVTGDGRDDAILLIHDRLIVYPQE